jgi:hypothetical protein
VRCPYCRLVMSDDSSRCGRCGAVRDAGRWVRGRPAAGPIGADAEVTDPGSRPGWTGTPRVEVPAPVLGRGCLWAGAAVVAVVVVGAVLALVAVAAGRDPAPSGPPWSPAYAASFEAACAATGAEASYCRCARNESERALTEDEMLRLQRRLGRGDPLDPADRQRLRDVEVRCAR